MKISKYYLFFSLFLLLPFLSVGQEAEPTQSSQIGNFILNGVIGMFIFYFTKVSQALGKFDFAYWWKDNRVGILANVAGIVIVTILFNFNPELLTTILGYIEVTLDEAGSIGTITFFVFFSGVIKEFAKKFEGKGVVLTDGQGNKLESAPKA